MINNIFATKIGMTQAWTSSGKRLAVTRVVVGENMVLGKTQQGESNLIFEIGYGKKKLKNMKKPLRAKLKKSGFSSGVRQVRMFGVKLDESSEDQSSLPEIGKTVRVENVLSVGDCVSVTGTSKGRGFAGAMKRWGFHGGPATHGQSDRARAVGSIGAGTTPGKVWKGKKMPGRYGGDQKTVQGLVVLHVDSKTQEVWLNGPIPGFLSSTIKIGKTGVSKEIKLDLKACGLSAQPEPSEKDSNSEKAQVAKSKDDQKQDNSKTQKKQNKEAKKPEKQDK